MRSLLWFATLRHLARHPWQLVLAIVGVGLGVGVMVAIDVANGSAQRAFELSSEAVTGRATHSIEGGVNGLPDELYRELRRQPDLGPVAPVIETFVTPVARPDRVLQLLGVDPFAEAPFRSYARVGPRRDVDWSLFLTRSRTALLDRQTARELGLDRGDRLAVDLGGTIRDLELVGLLDPTDERQRLAVADLLVVDIATAQELLGLDGRLTRIDLQLPDGERRQQAIDRLRHLLPADAELVPSAARSDTAHQMTRAFRLNLQALSLLGLLCGAFLIYNTMTFAVVQRRELLATLRALGTTRRQIVVLVLGEALLIGLVGVLLGETVGWYLGRGLVTLVTRTINDLYFVVTVRTVALPVGTVVKGVMVGLGATLAAAAAPAWEAGSTAPRAALVRSELEGSIHRALPLTSAIGLAVALVGGILVVVPGRNLALPFAGLFAMLVGSALLTPVATVGLMRLLTPVTGRLFGQLGRVATRGVTAALSRTGIAVAALTIALSVTVGVDLMIRSFRSTVSQWLEYTLPADLYISVFTSQSRRFSAVGTTLEPEVFDQLEALPAVAGANALRHFTATIDDYRTPAIAIDLDPRARGVFKFAQGDAVTIWQPFEEGRAVIISEPLAYRTGLKVGDTTELATPAGPRTVAIAGIHYDYSSERGVMFLDLDLYRRLWGDERLTALSLHAEPGVDLEDLRTEIRSLLGPDNRARIVSSRELRAQSMDVFDRTFLITSVLRILAVVVAFVGVLSSLMALQLERTRELGVLRACGLTPGQLWRLVTQQTGLMGLAAGLFAIPTGLLMAAIMTFVINRRSFGWSLHMDITVGGLMQAVVVAIVAALLAGCFPAWKMARTSPAESLREE